MRSFLILFQGSVGSTWLCDLLASHPNFYYVSFEPFYKMKQAKIPEITRNEFAEIVFSDPSLSEVQNKIHTFPVNTAQLKHNQYRFIFVKARLNALTNQIKNNLIPRFEVPIIYLYRENKVKWAISDIKRRDLDMGQFKYKKVTPPVTIDPKLIEARMEKLIQSESQIKSYVKSLETTNPVLHISYEEMLDRISYIINNKIAKFLKFDIDHRELTSKFSKVTKDDLREALENYDQVKSFFKGTKYEKYFDETNHIKKGSMAKIEALKQELGERQVRLQKYKELLNSIVDY